MTSFPAPLTERFRAFKNQKFQEQAASYHHLAEQGQSPEVMVISCVDSRVDPEAIFSAGPGELLVIRHIANLVPPHNKGAQYHSVSSALEFAVLNLKVKHIVVMGHSGCGGIKVSLDQNAAVQTDECFISSWVSVLETAKTNALTAHPNLSKEQIAEKVELEVVTQSLNNLRSFPFIKAQEDSGHLNLHGCHFRIGSGDLAVLNETDGTFDVL